MWLVHALCAGLQSRIREVKVDIEEGYDDRSAALEDMRNLTKQFEVDKLERQQVRNARLLCFHRSAAGWGACAVRCCARVTCGAAD